MIFAVGAAQQQSLLATPLIPPNDPPEASSIASKTLVSVAEAGTEEQEAEAGVREHQGDRTSVNPHRTEWTDMFRSLVEEARGAAQRGLGARGGEVETLGDRDRGVGSGVVEERMRALDRGRRRRSWIGRWMTIGDPLLAKVMAEWHRRDSRMALRLPQHQ